MDPNMKDGIRITVIATGFDAVKEQQSCRRREDGRILEMPRRTTYDRERPGHPGFPARKSRQAR